MVQTVFLVNRVFVPCPKGAVLTKTAKMTNLDSTQWRQGFRSSKHRKRRKWRKWRVSLRQRHGLEKAGFVLPWLDRYRPKGVFGKGVGNSQKCVRNASEMRLVLFGKEERPKCVRNPSKLRQKCVKNARNTFGENTFWTIPTRFQARDSWNPAIRDSRFCAVKVAIAPTCYKPTPKVLENPVTSLNKEVTGRFS